MDDDDLKERLDAIEALIRALPGRAAFGLLRTEAMSTRNAMEEIRRQVADIQRSIDEMQRG